MESHFEGSVSGVGEIIAGAFAAAGATVSLALILAKPLSTHRRRNRGLLDWLTLQRASWNIESGLQPMLFLGCFVASQQPLNALGIKTKNAPQNQDQFLQRHKCKSPSSTLLPRSSASSYPMKTANNQRPIRSRLIESGHKHVLQARLKKKPAPHG